MSWKLLPDYAAGQKSLQEVGIKYIHPIKGHQGEFVQLLFVRELFVLA